MTRFPTTGEPGHGVSIDGVVQAPATPTRTPFQEMAIPDGPPTLRVLIDGYLEDYALHEFRSMNTARPRSEHLSKRNGELLALAVGQFDAFLTADRNLSYQQDVSSFDIAIVVLVAQSNRFEDLRTLTPRILEMPPFAKRRVVTVVEA